MATLVKPTDPKVKINNSFTYKLGRNSLLWLATSWFTCRIKFDTDRKFIERLFTIHIDGGYRHKWMHVENLANTPDWWSLPEWEYCLYHRHGLDLSVVVLCLDVELFFSPIRTFTFFKY